MKNVPRIVVEAAVVCALAVSVGLNLFPPAGPGVSTGRDVTTGESAHISGTGPSAVPESSPPARTSGSGSYSPAELAALFGWKPVPVRPAVKKAEPGPSTEPRPAAREPVSAVWMALVGSVMGDGGRQIYFLKDSRRKQVIRVVEGEENDGYRALAADGKQFLLEREGELYKIEVK